MFGLPVVAGIVAIVISLLLTPIFTAKTSLLPPQSNSGGGVSAGGTTADTVVAMRKANTKEENRESFKALKKAGVLVCNCFKALFLVQFQRLKGSAFGHFVVFY